jgi:hypothetical protein
VQTREWVEIAKPSLPRGAMVITSGQASLADQTPMAIRTPAAHPPDRMPIQSAETSVKE